MRVAAASTSSALRVHEPRAGAARSTVLHHDAHDACFDSAALPAGVFVEGRLRWRSSMRRMASSALLRRCLDSRRFGTADVGPPDAGASDGDFASSMAAGRGWQAACKGAFIKWVGLMVYWWDFCPASACLGARLRMLPSGRVDEEASIDAAGSAWAAPMRREPASSGAGRWAPIRHGRSGC